MTCLLVFALALCSQRASAFLDPPYITPANPTAGDLVSVNIYGGECDLVDYGINWPPPVTQQGNELTIHFTGIHEEDPEFCYYGLGTSTYPVGTFPPASYTLFVERRYGTFSGWVTETLGVIPFTVSGTPTQQPIEAPAPGRTGLCALLLGLTAASLLGLRERMSQLLRLPVRLRANGGLVRPIP
jgi:hypothetical protein